jgi:hypothetical protein
MNRFLDIRHFILILELIFIYTQNKLITSIDLSPIHILQYPHKFKTEYDDDNSISGRDTTVYFPKTSENAAIVKICRWMSSRHMFVPVIYRDCFLWILTQKIFYSWTLRRRSFLHCSHNRVASLTGATVNLCPSLLAGSLFSGNSATLHHWKSVQRLYVLEWTTVDLLLENHFSLTWTFLG